MTSSRTRLPFRGPEPPPVEQRPKCRACRQPLRSEVSREGGIVETWEPVVEVEWREWNEQHEPQELHLARGRPHEFRTRPDGGHERLVSRSLHEPTHREGICSLPGDMHPSWCSLHCVLAWARATDAAERRHHKETAR